MQRHSTHLLQAILQTARHTSIHCTVIPGSYLTGCWLSTHYANLHLQHSSLTTSLFHQVLHKTPGSQQSLTQCTLQHLQCRGFAAQTQARAQSRALKTGLQKSAPSGTQALYLLAFTVAMIGVTYASVPLYRMFCQATGYGGTVQQGSTGADP